MLVHFKKIFYKNAKSIKINRSFATDRNFEEIKIPVPWGHIAAKWWGPQNSRPILALHGWQDNAGTFDRLVPYLPSQIGILAVDYPGHGFSSNLPNGAFYHGIGAPLFLKTIVKYFNWPKVSFLSHSIGAMYSVMYTMFYPDEVDFLICLDGLFYILPNVMLADKMRKTINDFLRYDAVVNSKSKSPVYTFDKLEEILHAGSYYSVNLDCCKYILNRNIKAADADLRLYYLTKDLRLKVPSLMQWSKEDLLEDIKRVKCPLFFSLGTNSYIRRYKDVFVEILDTLRKHNNHIFEYDVEGTHHGHLNTPENVGNLVNDFIMKFYTSDNDLDKVKN